MPNREKLRIRLMDNALIEPVARFVDSWNHDDVYNRFGWTGADAQQRLVAELTNSARRAVVAIYDGAVIGLLDHVYAGDAIHVGIVVDWKFRRSSVGTLLLRALLAMKTPAQPIAAECRVDNIPAAGLLRKCGFRWIGTERPEMMWRYC